MGELIQIDAEPEAPADKAPEETADPGPSNGKKEESPKEAAKEEASKEDASNKEKAKKDDEASPDEGADDELEQEAALARLKGGDPSVSGKKELDKSMQVKLKHLSDELAQCQKAAGGVQPQSTAADAPADAKADSKQQDTIKEAVEKAKTKTHDADVKDKVI